MKTQSSNKISEWVASQFFLKSCYFYFSSKRKKVSSLLATICFVGQTSAFTPLL